MSGADDLPGPLLRWYERSARDLPWRRPGTTPWAVLVSEFMLQQTPVVRVLPVWAAWLHRWPTPAALAADSAGDAVRIWGKLGYPRRALRLHECARLLLERHGGEVPDDVDALLTLPGVGAYTARATAAFAFGRRVPVVDTNVRRVVARAVLGRADAGPPSATRDQEVVAALLPTAPAAAARVSVALMELGALVCVARTPRCAQCPLADRCAWLAAGAPPSTGPSAPRQRFAGTDREVRGRLLDVLRGSPGAVAAATLDLAWPDAVQRERALAGLLADGLVRRATGATFALPS
jgi:A/G-specific adenine glycosylase